MLIGKPGLAQTAISTADESSVTVRGMDLATELMGVVSFTDFFFIHVTGRRPSENQRFFLDALLVAIAEHGLMPSIQAARMTLAAAPDAFHGAVAAGVLGCGSVILGTAELCSAVLLDAAKRSAGKHESARDAVVLEIARETKERGDRLPGFGHPLHRPVDPRSVRLIQLAKERRAAGRYLDLLLRLEKAAATVWGKSLVMNVSGPIAAILLDLEFPEAAIKGIPILARTAGIIGHLSEERESPIGFLLAAKGAEAIKFSGNTRRT